MKTENLNDMERDCAAYFAAERRFKATGKPEAILIAEESAWRIFKSDCEKRILLNNRILHLLLLAKRFEPSTKTTP